MIFNFYQNGSSSVSILLAISLFSFLCLSVQQGLNVQQQQASEIYQRYQAIQIAENQLNRQYLGLECENQRIQNGIRFQISCDQQVTVTYPLGVVKVR
ncbi:hypothetical protein CEP45_07445 [Mergibacter septicus]|uniref:DUF5374 domain-containing protein n=1 Tax=Mergibacter septicus TaxID=221402 RepID=UPI0011790CFB|nr:DUF5374 domain-containing protein [Mergibacter septicus]AWX14229.1 hypothetical protein CEP49_06540 [Mergibacter septicus]QDJ13689.1 hypothetical protein CEP45_07445 [Mergibacter septicus]